MRFSVAGGKPFRQVIADVAGIVGRSAMPVLENIRIDAEGESVQFSATDLEVGLRSSMGAVVDGCGSVLLPGRKLHELARALPDGEVVFEQVSEKRVRVSCGGVSYTMVSDPPDEFPRFPSADGISDFIVPGKELLDCLRQVSYAQSTELGRYFLCCVFMEILPPDTLRFVATDSRRLALSEYRREGLLAQVEEKRALMVPSPGVAAIQRALRGGGSVGVTVGVTAGDGLICRSGGRMVYVRLLEGEFPEYGRIMEGVRGIRVEVSREGLLAAVRRVGLFSPSDTRSMAFEIGEDGIIIESHTVDFGEAREEVECRASESIRVGFQARYVEDILSSWDCDRVLIELKDATSATVWKPFDDSASECLLMPMKLDNF